MIEYFEKLFDTSDYPARWHCGNWSSGEGWLHIVSDVATFGAYVAIPCVLIWFVRKREDVVFPKVFWLFAAFIFACGSVHLIEAIIFWHPIYRFSGLMKCLTAVVSWATVIAVVRIAPTAIRLPSLIALNERLQIEVNERRKIEERLNSILNSISDGVMVSDRGGNFEFLNPAAKRIFQFEESDKSYQERFRRYSLYADNGQRQLIGDDLPLLRAGAGELIQDMELVVRCPAKNLEVTIELSASPIADESQKRAGAVAVFHDVTELKHERSTRMETEARLAAIVDSMSDGVVVASGDGTLEMLNPAATTILGIANTNASKDQWSSAYGLYHPDTNELFAIEDLPLVKALAVASRVDQEMIVRNASLAEDVRIAVRATPIRNNDGNITGAVAVFHDVTDAKQIEIERIENLGRLRAKTELAAAVAEATQNTPDDNRPMLLAIAQWLDVEWIALATCTLDDIVEWLSMDAEGNHMSTCQFRKSEWVPFDCDQVSTQALKIEQIKTPDGVEWVNVIVCGLQRDEAIRGVLMVARSNQAFSEGDMLQLERLSVLVAPAVFTRQQLVESQHQRQAMEAHLNEAREQVDRLSRVNTLGELTAGIAHELNQPLTAIVNFTDEAHSLMNETLTKESIAEVASLTRKAFEQAVRAGDVLRSIRSIMRKQTGQRVEFDMLKLVRETTELLSEKTQHLETRVDCDPMSSAILLEADRTQIQQVLINLIDNAVTAVAGCERKEIEIRLSQKSDEVIVSVSDTGVGIETSQANRVFDAFYSSDTGGLGLGLKICRSIAELHGGRIEVANNADCGAIFSLTLPRTRLKKESVA